MKLRSSFRGALEVCAVLGAVFGLGDLARVVAKEISYAWEPLAIAVWTVRSVGLAFAVGFALVFPATWILSLLLRGEDSLVRARRLAAGAWIFFHVFLILLWQGYQSLERELSLRRILVKIAFAAVALAAAWLLAGAAGRLAGAVARGLRGRGGIAAATVVLLALGGAYAASNRVSPANVLPGRNVLVILVDTLRADGLASYGNKRPTSPRIDRFAAQGVRFENAFAESSWTIPTVASIFTGVYPAVHRTTNYQSVLPKELLTLAEAFQAAGYTTGGRISNILINERHGYLQGFDDGRVVMNLYKLLFFEKLLAQARITAHYDFSTAEEISDAAISWLRRNDRRRFFLYVHYYDPHFPYTPPEPYAMKFIDPAMAKRFPYHAFVGDTLWNLVAEYKMGTRKKPEEIAAVRAAYDGEVLYTDAQIGRLLTYVRAVGLDENTVVVFVADHGEQFYEHGERLHSKTLYNEEIHVPLIIRAPGVTPRVVKRRVRSLDLYPTLAEMADLPRRLEGRPEGGTLLRQAMGVSLAPILAGGDLPAAYQDEVFASVDIDGVVKEATFLGPWKLIQNLKRGDALPRPPMELYEIEQDPPERHDRADADRVMRDRLAGARARAEKWMASRAVRKVERKALGASDAEKLKALGYINQ